MRPERGPAFGLETLPGASELGAAEYVYRQILDAVLSQRLRPGARLTELGLADIFSVGRSTVREVLHRLAAEGVVDLRANRGASVSRPAPDEADSLFEARRIIEGELVGRTARAVNTGTLAVVDIEPLRALADDEALHIAAGRRGAALRLACEFHVALSRFGAVPPLCDALQRQVVRTALAIGLYERAEHDFDAARSRKALLQPIVAGDAKRARRAMRAHLDAVQRSLDLAAHPAGGDLEAAFRHLSPR